MNKTYVFFVGGTGARVLRSLTMLLASGCRMKDGGAIVPVVIDYDVKNGDLKEAKDLLDCYCNISKTAKYEEQEEGFSARNWTSRKAPTPRYSMRTATRLSAISCHTILWPTGTVSRR